MGLACNKCVKPCEAALLGVSVFRSDNPRRAKYVGAEWWLSWRCQEKVKIRMPGRACGRARLVVPSPDERADAAQLTSTLLLRSAQRYGRRRRRPNGNVGLDSLKYHGYDECVRDRPNGKLAGLLTVKETAVAMQVLPEGAAASWNRNIRFGRILWKHVPFASCALVCFFS